MVIDEFNDSGILIDIGLTLSADVPGCLVTASTDKSIKVWDYSNGKPAFVMSKDMKMVCISMNLYQKMNRA